MVVQDLSKILAGRATTGFWAMMKVLVVVLRVWLVSSASEGRV